MKTNIGPAKAWNPWLWLWVASEDVAQAHKLIMEKAGELPPHDVFFVNADDSAALEPTKELVERFRPELAPLAARLYGHEPLISNKKLKKAVGWRPAWRWR